MSHPSDRNERMKYEVSEDSNGFWAWTGSVDDCVIILSGGHASEVECRTNLERYATKMLIAGLIEENEKDQHRMKQAKRLLIVIPLTFAAFVGFFLVYKHLVVPQQAVWNEEKPVHWSQDKIPLQVGGEYNAALREAVFLWNRQAKCTLFEMHKEPIVVVKQGSIEVGAESEDWAAGAFVDKDATRGEVIVYVPLMVGTDLQVLHHELGHILGLAHDRSHTMLPLKEETISGRQQFVSAQDKDIAALRARYCGGDE